MEHFSDILLRLSGILGVVCYISAYALLQTGVIRGSSYTYAFLNMLASCLVLASLVLEFNLASAMIQISWILISVFGLMRIFVLTRRTRFNEEESEMLGEAFAKMPKPMARKLMSRGVWANYVPGTELTREGEAVSHLYFLRRGRALVVSGGKSIAEIGTGLVGEMNVLAEGPASATVTVSEPSRVFSIAGTHLRQLSATDPELSMALEQHLNLATQEKLVVANAQLAHAARMP